MGTRIDWTQRAKVDLRAIDQGTALRILHSLDRFVHEGEGDVKQLKGSDPPEFRLRAGDYRVRFRRQEGRVEILAIKHRSEAYR